jgi:hypothetical protein
MKAERTQSDFAGENVDLHCYPHTLWLQKQNATIEVYTHWGSWGSLPEIICLNHRGFTMTLQQVECPMKSPRRAGLLLDKISFSLIRPKPCIACALIVDAHQYRRTGNYSSTLIIHTVLLTGKHSHTTCM